VEQEKITYKEAKVGTALEWFLDQKRLNPHVIIAIIIAGTGISLSLYHLFTGYAGPVESHSFRSTHLAFIMILAFFFRPLGRNSWKDTIRWTFYVDMALILLIIAIQMYTLYDIEEFIWRRGDLTKWDLWAGTILIILLLEATRRVVGWAMVIIVSFFLFQTAFSDHFFSILYGPPNSWFTILDYIFMRENGIYGIPIMVMATYIFLFILFGSILIRSGAGRFFINIALALTGNRTGGPAKASIVSSALMATVSGSAVANVVTTGSFTIPLMKKAGYRSHIAGAVEACSSSGGQIMPPVMGAAAFIIAEFLAIPYLKVCAAALVPATLYFFSIFVMVHFEAKKYNLGALQKKELPDLKQEIKRGGHLLIAILVIIVILILGYTAMFAAFAAILSVFALSFLRRETRMSPIDILSALEDGAIKSIPVSIACASAGIIIGCVFVSGLGLKFTNLIIDIAAGRLWIALVLTMIASLILGMGLTTTAVYITVAALVVPSLVDMGVEPIAAHLFAFYYGIVSAITPPVALAAFAGAGIAGSNPMQTGFYSMRLGFSKYIIPIIFVYVPGMLLIGHPIDIIRYILMAFIGIFCLTIATEGLLYKRVSFVWRILMVPISFMIFMPQLEYNIMGCVILAGFIAKEKWMARQLQEA
jgi:TRAP transporter 4TM/12TM fusion protein